MIETQVQGVLQICGVNCRYNCLIFQLHLLQAIRLQIEHGEITPFDESNHILPVS